MAYPSAGHPNCQSTSIPSLLAVSISKFRSFIDQLIEGGIHVIRKLYLGHGFHPLGSSSNRKPNNSLFTQRRIEDSLSSVVVCEVHTAAEDSAEGNIFSEEQDRLIRSQSKGESII